MSKKSILDAWIMVERLSEGDIKRNDKTMIFFGEEEISDYYSLFRDIYDKKINDLKYKGKNSGLVLYLNIFPFDDVLKTLRNTFQLSAPVESVDTKEKFTVALYFDSELRILTDMMFYTASDYILRKREIPDEDKFQEYERDLKEKVDQYFSDFLTLLENLENTEADEEELSDDNEDQEKHGKNSEKKVKREFTEGEKLQLAAAFNKAFDDCLKLLEIDIHQARCKLKVLGNVDTDATNLHSFFTTDLEWAKESDSSNLERYLFGVPQGLSRFNLDSKSDSDNFAPGYFEQILAPQKYPMGRFPSATKFPLYFMQQIAVNLYKGFEESQMLSVNGPPGTGKTTLLKDIFAELIVEQAKEICGLSKKKITGNMKYEDNFKTASLPPELALKGIVVASSNNAAVQNIVKELPKIGDIDKNLQEEIKEADYFYDIANGIDADEEEDASKEGTYWGLFSIEGGKKSNIDTLLQKIDDVYKYLKDEEKPEEEEDPYDAFIEQYHKVEGIRRRVLNYEASQSDRVKYHDAKRNLEVSIQKKKAEAEKNKAVLKAELDDYKQDLTAVELQFAQKQQEVNALKENLKSLSEECKELQNHLVRNKIPSLLDKVFNKKESDLYERIGMLFFEKKEQCDQLQQRLNTEEKQLKQYEQQRNLLQRTITTKQDQSAKILAMVEKEGEKGKQELERCKADYLKKYGIEIEAPVSEKHKPLNMSLPYEELQMTNPWYDEEYRIEQSRLFIRALSVRKEFLRENKNHVLAAKKIWQKQDAYASEKRELVCAAWSWINFTIPVISTTFASMGRMFRNLKENSLGCLFIDEAGQALPQAAVGAVLRSTRVMAVGDPAQIKPVLTLDESVLKMLGKNYGVSEKYMSDSASVQTLVDAAGIYGYYRDPDQTPESWIGIPLWVHRRCSDPMFSIANRISYNGNMVLGKEKKNGKAGWFDIKGKAIDKYVKEQAEFLKQKILELSESRPDILDPSQENDSIYVITPFKNVAYQLSRVLDKIHFTRYMEDEENKGSKKVRNIGTVHTFQGKEAPIVFLVLGADEPSRLAAKWAVSEPNIMNVAATRAKEEFYIIGDRQLYSGLESEVIRDTCSELKKYKKRCPDLYVEYQAPQETEDTKAEEKKVEEKKAEDTKPVEKKSEETKPVEKKKESEKIETKGEGSKKSAAGSAKWIGNKEQKFFHNPGCKWEPKKKEKRIVFSSFKEATDAGYKPCNECKPAE